MALTPCGRGWLKMACAEEKEKVKALEGESAHCWIASYLFYS
jgi:hypothetical protein